MDTPNRPNTAFVGDMPANYDRLLRGLFFDPYAADLSVRVAADQPDSIVELACGTGALTAKLAELLPQSELIATDISPDMLRIAEENLGNRAQFRVLDAHNIADLGRTFGAAACQFGVMFFEDRVGAYTAIRQALKPGGAFHFNTWGPMEQNPIAMLAHGTLVSLFPDDPPRFFTVPFGYCDEELIRSELLQAGFGSVDIEAVTLDSGEITSEDAGYALIHAGPVAAALREGGADLDWVVAAMRAAFKDRFGERFAAPMMALVVRAA